MGIVYLLLGNLMGVVLLAVGIGMEYWQRRRGRQQEG